MRSMKGADNLTDRELRDWRAWVMEKRCRSSELTREELDALRAHVDAYWRAVGMGTIAADVFARSVFLCRIFGPESDLVRAALKGDLYAAFCESEINSCISFDVLQFKDFYLVCDAASRWRRFSKPFNQMCPIFIRDISLFCALEDLPDWSLEGVRRSLADETQSAGLNLIDDMLALFARIRHA